MKLAPTLAFLLFLVFSTTNALTTDDLLDALVDVKDNEMLKSFPGALHKDLPKEGGYALVKFLVKPQQAKGFIEVVKESKKGAENSKGYIAYDLVKTLDDNISYFNWYAFASKEDFLAFVTSDILKEVKEYIKKEDIVALISNLPIVTFGSDIIDHLYDLYHQ